MGRQPGGCDERERSQYHLRARAVLAALFPLDRRSEEVPLPGTGKLTLDFLVLSYRLAVEVHGEQHYKYVPHFHKSKLAFLQAKQRDANKRRWCELNNLRLVELPYNEDDDEWRKRITSADG